MSDIEIVFLLMQGRLTVGVRTGLEGVDKQGAVTVAITAGETVLLHDVMPRDVLLHQVACVHAQVVLGHREET